MNRPNQNKLQQYNAEIQYHMFQLLKNLGISAQYNFPIFPTHDDLNHMIDYVKSLRKENIELRFDLTTEQKEQLQNQCDTIVEMLKQYI